MNVIPKRSALLLAGILAAALAGFAGNGKPHRFEFFIVYGPSLAGGAAVYPNAYNPHPGYIIPGSYVRQTLAIDPATAERLAAGGTYFLGRGLGIRLALLFESRPIGGENTPYDYLYLYTTTIPPDYVPVDTSYARTVDWPSSEGRIKEWGGRLELVWRRPVSSALEIAVAGGLSLTSAGGRLHPLGFTDQWEGGHGVLFLEDYLVYLKLPARMIAGAVLGLEASLRLSEHFWLRMGADYQITGSYEATPEIQRVLSYYSLDEATTETVRLVESRFDLQPLRLSLSHASFGVGISFRL
ncbi:MAG: hypothetical protein NTW38_08620 [Candidatus Aminicenantes bacterium]|nr:hypothetical protein [Candidatus Aminicenantes bacterium]